MAGFLYFGVDEITWNIFGHRLNTDEMDAFSCIAIGQIVGISMHRFWFAIDSLKTVHPVMFAFPLSGTDPGM